MVTPQNFIHRLKSEIYIQVIVQNEYRHMKELLERFCVVTPQDFFHRLKLRTALSKYHHVKVLLKTFRLNGNTIGFCTNKQYHVKVLLKRFHLNGHTIGFHPQTQNLKLHAKQIAPCARIRLSFTLDPRSNSARFWTAEFASLVSENVLPVQFQVCADSCKHLNHAQFVR